MLSAEIKQTLTSYTADMAHPVTFVLQTGEHEKRDELKAFLQDIASVSDNILFKERDVSSPESANPLRSPISFLLEAQGEDSGVRFSGIPSGHEFNSLILALLQASGRAMKLDESLQNMVKKIKEPLKFEVFVSLSCHNCPEVVQALNQFALLNSQISAEMIDGGLFQEVVKDRDIQGVPSVYVNGELFANGKVTAAQLIEKLIERDPAIQQTQTKEQMPLQDVVVVGGGPAGVGAAIYSARKGLKVTLVADRIGGQVKDTQGIENFVSVKMTTGSELSGNLHAHLAEHDVTIKEHLKVTTVEQGPIKSVTLSSGETIETKTIILATGAKWRELGVPGEKENIGNGVAYCPHCDGPFFKGKDVAVIGGGNSGIEAALDLAGIVKSVTVFEFMPELKADKVLVDQAEARDNITIRTHVQTEAIVAKDGKVSGIQYKTRDDDESHTQSLDGVFVQIGLIPNTSFLGDLVELNRFGEVVVNAKGETSAYGIFAAGDATTVPFKQIVIAMGEGTKASLSAFEYLLAKGAELEGKAAEVSMKKSA